MNTKLVTEALLDQCLLYGLPWKTALDLYFVKYSKNPYKTFATVTLLFLAMLLLYFCTLGAVNIKTLIYPHYKNYQKYLLLVAKNREGIYTKEDVQKLCKDDQLDYVFIEYMLI